MSELLKSNSDLRDKLEKQEVKIDRKNVQLFEYQHENESLRERIDILEKVIANNKDEYNRMVSKRASTLLEQEELHLFKV